MPQVLRFPPFELHATARTLYREGHAVPLGARAFDLLLALTEVHGRLVTKDELMQRAWPGVVVEEANIHVQVSQLRKLLGADAIATVQGLGYRFARAVHTGGAAGGPGHRLPAERTAFIGREAAVADALGQLARTRLLTLVGIGGTGKTRLARRLAGLALESHPDGVWWVDLAPVDSPTRLVSAVMQAVGCHLGAEASPESALAEYLHRRRALLVLDNCEHLLDAVERLVDLLLDATTLLTIVATSREALSARGELALPVRPMAVPAAGSPGEDADRCESVRLFAQTALQAHPDFTLDADNAADVAAICRALDGLPLAIELAAARMRVVAPRQLLAALQERFRVLDGPRRALPRQQTLRTVIQWSWEHLREHEQALMSALALCAGSADLAAARAICLPADAAAAATDGNCAPLLAGLGRLMDQSLITVTHDHGVARYRLLETVAQFAQEKLADSGRLELLRDRHLDHFAARVARWSERWDGPHHLATLADADADHQNAVRALDWAVSLGRWRVAAGLADALQPWWAARSSGSVALEVIDAVLAIVPAQADDPIVATLQGHRSRFARFRGDLLAARDAAQRAVDSAERSGDARARLDAQVLLARCDHREGRLDAAVAAVLPVVAEARRLALRDVLGDALNVLGLAQMDRGDLDAARAAHGESAELSIQAGHSYDIVVDGVCLATVALEAGDPAQARLCMRAVMSTRAALAHPELDQMWLDLAAWLASLDGRWARAVARFCLADRFARDHEFGRSAHWHATSARCLNQAREALGAAEWQAAWDGAETISAVQVLAEVDSELGGLG